MIFVVWAPYYTIQNTNDLLIKANNNSKNITEMRNKFYLAQMKKEDKLNKLKWFIYVSIEKTTFSVERG